MTPSELFLIVISFFTSTITAITGAGGGTLLITLMPGLLPGAAIVPVHGVVQFFSNFSRVAFAWRSVKWDLLKRYFPGACVGAFIGSQFVLSINSQLIPLILGVSILFITWVPNLPLNKLPGRFFTFGIINSILSVFAGATAPLAAAMLYRENLKQDSLVTTVGAFMLSSHALKAVAFGVLGVNLMPYLPLISGMSLSVMLGSWVGTKLRGKVPEKSYKPFFRWVISVLAIRSIWIALS